ncbi:uncharacterized protein DUF4333 [Rhodococcus sp. OK519]|uniref:DUF4333 domain-containing protein n=1 Tax=Rhodococcus sp. OK519 TaxID=2135729 RepID=UPI000D3A515C|nr:uncharacterized protein DUF4333 [Rhodococcus sp. OK519]
MSGPYDSNTQWSRDGGSVEGAGAPAPAEQFPQHAYPADVRGAGPYRGSDQVQGQTWGQAHPGAPGPAPGTQWGQSPQGWPQHNQGQPNPGQQWGAPAPGQPQMFPGYPQQPQPYGGQPINQWAPQQPGQPVPGQGRNKTMLWVGIGIAAVVVVGLVAWLLSALLGGKTLDQEAAQRGVEQIVTDSYGARSVTGVSCPSGQKVEKGTSFECALTVDGSQKTVKLTFTDDEGTYEVSRPS